MSYYYTRAGSQATYPPQILQGYLATTYSSYSEQPGIRFGNPMDLKDRQYSSDSGYTSDSPINSPMSQHPTSISTSLNSPVSQYFPSTSYRSSEFVTVPCGQNHSQRMTAVHPKLQNNHPATQQMDSSSATTTTSRPANRSKTSVPLPSSNDQYVCLHVGCDRSFSRSHDLKRHGRIHFPDSATWIDCEGKGCGRVGRPQQGEKGGFSRRDHYVEHLRKVHKKDIPKGRGSGKNVWVPVNSLSIVAESA